MIKNEMVEFNSELENITSKIDALISMTQVYLLK